MDKKQFWSLIEAAGRTTDGNCTAQSEILLDKLSRRSAANIRDFEAIFAEYMREAYSYDLWAAAYIINGGCSDDGFEYFRSWLIAQGQTVYDAALQNPESLAELPDYNFIKMDDTTYIAECEEMLQLGASAYSDKTGQELEFVAYNKAKPDGDPFDEENVGNKYSKLAARFNYE